MNRFKRGASCLFCLLLVQTAFAETFKLQISKETTRITTPLLPDGTPDYLRAYEQQAAAGVTPQNNAGAVIQRLLGLPWPKGAPGGPDPDAPASATAPASQSATQPTPYVFEDWKSYGTRQGGNGPQHEAWLKLQAEKLQKPVDRTEHEPWKADDFPLLAQYLAAQEAPLKLLAAATLRPRYFLPQRQVTAPTVAWDKSRPGIPGDLHKIRYMAKTLQMMAMLRAGSGDATGALEDAETIRRLARLVQQEPTILSMMVGASSDMMSWQTDLTLVQMDGLTQVQLSQLATETSTTEEFRFAPAALDIGERFLLLHFVMEAIHGNTQETVRLISGLESTFFFVDQNSPRPILALGDLPQTDWNIVLRILNQRIDGMLAIANLTDTIKQRDQALAFSTDHQIAKKAGIVINPIINETPKLDLNTKRRNLIEHLEAYLKRRADESPATYSERIAELFAGDSSLLATQFNVIQRPRVDQRQLQIVLALRAYHEVKGIYPTQLSELAPTFLARIPVDPFSNLPMIYRREGNGFILYSVGFNGKDDGGKDHLDQKDADDIVVKRSH
ncbi:MAG: hypothetical protein WCI73_11595 [Phycisphaerae bacterium]